MPLLDDKYKRSRETISTTAIKGAGNPTYFNGTFEVEF